MRVILYMYMCFKLLFCPSLLCVWNRCFCSVKEGCGRPNYGRFVYLCYCSVIVDLRGYFELNTLAFYHAPAVRSTLF